MTSTGRSTTSARPAAGVPVVDELTDTREQVPGRNWLRLAMLVAVALVLLVAVAIAVNLGRGKTPLGAEPDDDEPSTSSSPTVTTPRAVTDAVHRPRRRPTSTRRGTARRTPTTSAAAVDGDQTTSWTTLTYKQQLGPDGLKRGVGLVVDLGQSRAVRRVDLTLVGVPTALSLYLTDDVPTNPEELTPVGEVQADGAAATVDLDDAPTGRYLTIWFTSLPAVDGGYKGGIVDLVVAGMNSPAEAELTDHELLQAHVDGDPDAFAILFRQHRDRLWAVALRTMGNPDDAADGLQDGMIAAYRRAGSFRGDAAVTTWLHRVVVNACLDRLRAAKVRRAEPLPEDLEDIGDRGSLVTSTTEAADPADLAVVEERRRIVLAALDQLPADQKAALILVDMEGYPVAEVAAMLDCAVGTVKSRCSRGRARLATLLGVLRPGGDPDHGPPGNPDPLPSVRTTEASRAPPDPG